MIKIKIFREIKEKERRGLSGIMSKEKEIEWLSFNRKRFSERKEKRKRNEKWWRKKRWK